VIRGSNRLKDRGFQGSFPVLILSCGEGRNEGKEGVGKAANAGKLPTWEGTLVTIPRNHLFIVMNLLDLIRLIAYDFSVQETRFLSIQIYPRGYLS
jgi:hypothetical protein